MELEEALEEAIKDLGFDKIKPKQREAIEAFASGNDVFVSLPTGYGKSIILPTFFKKLKGKPINILCSEVLNICSGIDDAIVVCVSPLTSIMMDQREKCQSKGLTAEFLGGAQTDPTAIRKVLQGDVQIVFTSPKNLLDN